VRLRNRRHERRCSNRSPAQAKANARFHYGLGWDFYSRWLDVPLMMYTCAYWRDDTRTVEEAQRNKIEHVCRKIRLAEGERFLDVGTGFGGFLFHAYERFGALGTGINTTTEQVEWLRGEIERRGLAGRLQVVEADFREVQGQFDKVVSVGTLEHAGPDQLAEVVRAHADSLKPGGLGCCTSSVTSNRATPSTSYASTSFPAAGSPACPTRWPRWAGAAWRSSRWRTCGGTTL
jgi:cyclopropane-fatty-acyl-phospholipid synthase